jgi:hypothetical protein
MREKSSWSVALRAVGARNLPVAAEPQRVDLALLTFQSKIGSTCDLGVQNVSLTPGASSTCGGGNCSCSSCCCW